MKPKLSHVITALFVISPVVAAMGAVNYHSYISEQHIDCVQSHNAQTHEIQRFKTFVAELPVCVQTKPYTGITSH